MSETRQVYRSAATEKMRFKKNFIFGLVIFLAVSAVIYVIAGIYSPPSHDKKSHKGRPIPDDNYIYTRVVSDFEYVFYLSANLYMQEDGSLNIYLTNPEDSEVDLLCKVKDAETGDVLYKSGRILAGEYVATLKPEGRIDNVKRDIFVEIYALNSETFISEGTTRLDLVLQPW